MLMDACGPARLTDDSTVPVISNSASRYPPQPWWALTERVESSATTPNAAAMSVPNRRRDDVLMANLLGPFYAARSGRSLVTCAPLTGDLMRTLTARVALPLAAAAAATLVTARAQTPLARPAFPGQTNAP